MRTIKALDHLSGGKRESAVASHRCGSGGMTITTTLACGDKAWVFHDDRAQLFTIGQVRVEITDSPGMGDETYSNYGPQHGREEQYMCVESGIRSGSLYTIGETLFLTMEECVEANAKYIAEQKAEEVRREEYARQRLLSEESYLRNKLARIEALKAGA